MADKSNASVEFFKIGMVIGFAILATAFILLKILIEMCCGHRSR